MPVTFTEKDHRYTSHLGETYTSVTTLIKKFTPPFDADYWSAYKALQAVLTREGVWEKYKRQAGGWENVVTYAREIDKAFAFRKEVIEEKRKILQQWDEVKDEALEKGSIYHKMREDGVKEKVIFTPDLVEIPILSGDDILSIQNFDSDGLYPELILYNDEWKLAGQADWVMKRGRKIDIKDYKTSKEIKKTAFRDEKLMYPLDHLPNANYYTYSIQLSLYARMLEECGYEIGKLFIEHVDKHTQRTIEMHAVQYHRNEVDELIKEHLKSVRKKKKPA